LLASGGGSIVNNASTLGVIGMPMIAPYVAAKHGVIGLTQSVAVELAQSGVRVNALVTGAVETPMLEGFIDGDAERAAQNAGMHPQNRVGTPEEIAGFAAYLLSDESTFITGAALAIDGGWTAK
jgi:NAD(P)-dependent dehydrogenase (short-subunit alcohol dehydrogenase family)